MQRLTAYTFTIVASSFVTAAVALAATSSRREASAKRAGRDGWDARAAAAYLDYRQTWWESWSRSARDHGTHCLSCHTAVSYALARPQLESALHESEEPAAEQKLVADVLTRVRGWSEMEPYYGNATPDGHRNAVKSRGTESVLNALVLAGRDARAGTVSADATTAFANMWALQLSTGSDAGAWSWLDFGLEPWESAPSGYFGAALAAIAVGTEPGGYSARADIQPSLDHLRRYLRDNVDQPFFDRVMRHDDPALLNRAMLLWASSRLPELTSANERQALVDGLFHAQLADGGWSVASLGRWHRLDNSPAQTGSDGYATGLVAYALEQGGTPTSEPRLAKALAWLEQHQDRATGMWETMSLNKQRDLDSDVGKFMSDAATAYAVLALAATAPADEHR